MKLITQTSKVLFYSLSFLNYLNPLFLRFFTLFTSSYFEDIRAMKLAFRMESRKKLNSQTLSLAEFCDLFLAFSSDFDVSDNRFSVISKTSKEKRTEQCISVDC